ncbi:zinc-dependent metalloprotease [Stackebrandtia nassauensis]|uniref:Coenzyme F420 biosynthesis-associated protein n=1 Tax=Stackebrandtia nassauensis (strain DSM 44728 / CIP 108903 / NRRL B-16338 / NBRC 102104 / LLR-40K-21) TaxID=446470 RepID=D3Q837_STANL|nr:zinc-dependent metalloprotease [Stackebrandtia nassauensis]ADD40542.1 conserved hypothetical protein [Stackebrandtia nassauensis DSM 44728]
MTQFVDWDLAAATARTIGRAGPDIGLEDATEAVHELRGYAVEAAGHVAEFTGMEPRQQPPLRVVDRAGWAAANIEGLRGVLDPLASRAGAEAGTVARVVGARVAGAQAGVVLGYLSGKILGQYEIFSKQPGQLLLVAPNIIEAERQLKADPRDFQMWICLHEATHAAQFGAVEWLRPHFMSEIEAFGAAATETNAGLVERVRRTLGVLADALRDAKAGSSVVDLVTSPRQREIVDRLTAMMTLIEGHADYVMDAIGPDVVSHVEELRKRFDRRRASGSAAQRVVRRALGMDLKLKQYTQGKKFTAAVVDQVGIDGFNAVWEQPSHLPTLSEIDDPDAWIARVVRS